ncbi:MAG TPA: AraC family transcriptional regulator [Chitinophaga sp.]|uniref:AraC family transcriptional regulator n=1 Tax=Chitinophaga sp. TaxID=1869181 RepID=UPI002F93E640
MKPILRKVAVHGGHSFSVREDVLPYLYNHWHYHPEVELTLIRKGRGTRLVGDHMERFTDGDLVLLGPNLPHMWRNDADYFQPDSGLHIEAVAIHFHENFWGDAFLQLPEMEPVRMLLKQAGRGLQIHGKAKAALSLQMEEILQATGPQKITLLIHLLTAIAATPEKSFLSSLGFVQEYNLQRTDKINEIYHYTFNNFTQALSIETVAKAVHISPHSFCRYFKTRTSKTYFQFLAELRIGYACKLLLENDMSIAQVAYSSGFNNLANFNRQFKAITGKTPMGYFKGYAGKVVIGSS